MVTILSANGVIGCELSRHLPMSTDRICQVSRSPRRVNQTNELFAADMPEPRGTTNEVAGRTIDYFVAGLACHGATNHHGQRSP